MAVVAVVVYHLGLSATPGGFLGVDMFFVLSGYLITGLLLRERARRGRISFPRFWARRVRRLFPALIVVLLAVVGIVRLLDPADQPAELRVDGVATLFYVVNWAFISTGQSYVETFATPSPLRHAWSLSIEEQFYLVWPLVVGGLLWLAHGRRRLLVAVTALGAAGSAVVMATLYFSAEHARVYFGTDARVHELFIGALLAVALDSEPVRQQVRRVAEPLAVAAVAAMVVAFVLVTEDAPAYFLGGSVVFCLTVAALIAALESQPSGMVARLLSRPVPRWLGRVSYGLYLWHWPAIVFLTPDSTGLAGLWLSAVQVGATLTAATASYYLVEQPIRSGRVTARVRPRHVAFALPVVNVVVLGALLVGTAGVGAGTGTGVGEDERPGVTRYPATATWTSADSSTVADDDAVVGLVGDSVAVALEPALHEQMGRRGWTLVSIAAGGCPVAKVLHLDVRGKQPPWARSCVDWMSRLQKTMVHRERPDVVVWLSGRENHGLLERDGSRAMSGSNTFHRQLLRAFEDTYDRLSSGGARVVIVRQTPRPDPPPGCGHHVVGSDERCLSAGRFNKRLPVLNSLFDEIASRHPGRVSVLSVDDLVCPDGPPCPARIDDEVVRRDGIHFSDEFAPRVVRAIVRRVQGDLAERRTRPSTDGGSVPPSQE